MPSRTSSRRAGPLFKPPADHFVVEQTIRPLRLAMIVDPEDMGSVRRAIECNTAQWGGIFNPLIPVYRRRPPWWKPPLLRPKHLPSARQLSAAAIEAWDPDFLVECRSRHGRVEVETERPWMDRHRLLWASRREEGQKAKAGVSSGFVYKTLHQKTFQFLRPQGPEAVVPSGQQPFDHMVAACFGAFPSGTNGRDLELNYREDLRATDITVAAKELFSLHRVGDRNSVRLVWPLAIGVEGLKSFSSRPINRDVLFLHDPESPIDLIDFWNIRSSVRSCLPVPLQWSEEAASIWLQEAPRSPTDPGSEVAVAAGRRTPEAALEDFRSALSEGSFQVRTDPGLTIWDDRRESLGIGQVIAAQRRDEIVGKDRVKVALVVPEIGPEGRTPNLDAWASVVNIRSRGETHANLIPTGLSGVGQLFEAYEPLRIEARREGLVSVIGPETDLDLRPPSGADVFAAFTAQKGFEPEISDPGRVVLEIIRRLGSLAAVGLIQHPAIIDALGRAVRSPLASVGRSQLWRALMEAREEEWRAENLLRLLLEKRVFDPGVILKCPDCANANWYSPDALGHRLNCNRCLNDFSFPGDHPPKENQWAYRPRGGFATPEHARGAYTVLLALRLLADDAHNVTWAPCMTLDSTTEVDFALWRRSLNGGPGPEASPELVLGECKTFQKFRETDFSRMARLRRRFPGSTLVFATLRDSLEDSERAGLRTLAESSDRHQPTDLVILTSTELHARHGLPDAWHEAGGRLAGLAPKNLYGGVSDLAQIALVTQRMHLDPS